ncbi:Redox-sensing transcriptional repressor rex [Anaerohalosphaera lusitana]|uniref:Redox-sensing transcriptional repressor Rex n=1 Tax=Anaerohalosphaera lusitana TaxID=1936003 RepID=A0A1U9NLZ2_9BACT|nr:redox-sensing transcriptional repressor Rex [Anaerohalosphaera lusitana]AQT68972.1 Redox-sensing transcriptional repressor rex [Anaerohalosphaera lusitana]
MSQDKPVSVSHPTIRRLPAYLNILRKAQDENKTHISSTFIADKLGYEPIQVRKDLAGLGITGQAGVGFDAAELIDAILGFLGWDNATDAYLIGAGNLGSALAGYKGFKDYNLNILACFDSDLRKVGTEIHGKKVFGMERLAELIERTGVNIAILTLPDKAAQEITDKIVEAGIRAIWNFTTVKLDVPDGVIVERVDLAASLALLSRRTAEAMKNDK